MKFLIAALVLILGGGLVVLAEQPASSTVSQTIEATDEPIETPVIIVEEPLTTLQFPTPFWPNGLAPCVDFKLYTSYPPQCRNSEGELVYVPGDAFILPLPTP